MLERLLKEAQERVGLLRVNSLEKLRLYIQVKERTALIEEIGKINDPELLRILWGVGLDTELQAAVTTRLNQLIAG
jgi:hypothetical protein